MPHLQGVSREAAIAIGWQNAVRVSPPESTTPCGPGAAQAFPNSPKRYASPGLS